MVCNVRARARARTHTHTPHYAAMATSFPSLTTSFFLTIVTNILTQLVRRTFYGIFDVVCTVHHIAMS